MPRLTLDMRRLHRDATASGRKRDDLAPGGRPATGLMALVREHRDALVAMHASGLTWGAIAAALTAQGFTTADGRPLTGTALTGLISSLRRQTQRRELRLAARLGRADLVTATAPTPMPAVRRRLGLAPDLGLPPNPESLGTDAAIDEAMIRRANLAKLQDLLKD